MVLEIDDWKFDIDLTATMEYSAAEAADHCGCAYCRNFYAAVDGVYPELRPFLAQFGLDIEAPDELMPFASTMITNLYAVSGHILEAGKEPLKLNLLSVTPRSANSAQINTACPEPYFVLEVGIMDIPWVLDEPMVESEIVSPANEPSFLRKMWNRLLGGESDEKIRS